MKRHYPRGQNPYILILGVIVTLEVMIAGGMIFNIDFHSADIIALIFGFIVVFSGAVAILTDN